MHNKKTMDLALIRVDNRLVHGQILEGWVPFLNATCIMVVNDEVAGDLFRESVIKMVVPSDIDVYVYSIEEFSKSYMDHTEEGKAIILFSDIIDILTSYNLGFSFDKLNIGNLHKDEGKVSYSSSIFLDDNDIDNITYLIESGVDVEIQSIPKVKPAKFSDKIKK